MQRKELLNIQVLPKSENSDFQQRESGMAHTSYMEETAFFSLVQQGNTDMVKKMLDKYLASSIVIGRLSDDPVKQMKYWSVCCITLGTRYAIQGGLDEMTAFNMSDRCIMKIDKFTTVKEITEYLGELVITFTELVRENAYKECPTYIRQCMDYIDRHLHEKIMLSDLADIANFSGDYLSKQFKKYVGKTVREYILDKKLESAKAMLRGACDEKMIPYYLGFCSQTYFITNFKKKYGITPHRYALQNRAGAQSEAEIESQGDL